MFPRRLEGSRLTEHGQSTLIGLVLLIGMVMITSTGMFVVAGQMTTDLQHQSESERIEGAFVELSQQMETVSTTSDVSRSMDLEVGQNGAVVMTETGTIEIEGGDVDANVSIGAIEYQGRDGTKLAYQAGGVFRETGNETRVVSSPPLEYDAETETLMFPVIEVSDEAQLDSGQLELDHDYTDPLREAEIVENDTVTIEVTSEYYRGWETYFERQGGPTTVQDVDPHENGEAGTVTAEFGYQEIADAFRKEAIYATEFQTGGNVDIDAEKEAYPPLTEEVNRVVNETNSSDAEYDGQEVTDLGTVNEFNDSVSDGVYYAEGIEEDGHLSFDLSNGNATLVVDGDIIADGETITVRDYADGTQLSVYLTGDYDASNGGNTCVVDEGCYEDEDGSVIQLVTTSTSEVDFGPGGSSRFEGIIYAGGANEDWSQRNGCEMQVCVHSNPNFYGSLVASSVSLQGGQGGLDFEYDDSLQEEHIEIYPDPELLPPQLTYLNVAEHQISVSED
ncbi:DUF7289 family protein [Halobiforma nitratireducens]|uniref:DUF7305 domain-containing protein n=1 Tax=Halobiforma nitratireducens JCM 10879 TaxID=1227454 RepID=M0LYV5_9EURY|nr:hypothetical protein [Halobiforma nitratireducens]EMA38767.1 hypothetical protein C446_09613 [Halobiforma nitratireducens JCM 10879]